MFSRYLSTLTISLLTLAGCNKKENVAPTPTTTSSVAALATVVVPPPLPIRPIDEILKLQTFPEALNYARPKMKDETDDPSEGTVLFTAWARKNLSWKDAAPKMNETSIALLKKDPDEERGKRLCISGEIIQISADKIDGGKIYSGLLYNSGEVISFIAVKSTGDLLKNSLGKFCGIATGNYSYDNAGGGTTHAIRMVGMFDLPENKLEMKQPAITK